MNDEMNLGGLEEVEDGDVNGALEFVQKNGLIRDILAMMNTVDYENGDYDLQMESTIFTDSLQDSMVVNHILGLGLDDEDAVGIDFGIEVDLDACNEVLTVADIGKLPALPKLHILSNNDLATQYIIGRIRAVKKTIDDVPSIQARVEVVEYNGVIANNKSFGFSGLPMEMLQTVDFIKAINNNLEADKWYETKLDLSYDYDPDLDDESLDGLVIPKGTPVKVRKYTEEEDAGGGINYEVVIFLDNDGQEVELPAYFWNNETVSNIYGMVDLEGWIHKQVISESHGITMNTKGISISTKGSTDDTDSKDSSKSSELEDTFGEIDWDN